MKKVITKFYFDHAKYLVGDDVGNEAFLKIDYKNSKYRILPIKVTSAFKEKVAFVAKKLIIKKHNINFSDRIEI